VTAEACSARKPAHFGCIMAAESGGMKNIHLLNPAAKPQKTSNSLALRVTTQRSHPRPKFLDCCLLSHCPLLPNRQFHRPEASKGNGTVDDDDAIAVASALKDMSTLERT
jgi:hypothetical protein